MPTRRIVYRVGDREVGAELVVQDAPTPRRGVPQSPADVRLDFASLDAAIAHYGLPGRSAAGMRYVDWASVMQSYASLDRALDSLREGDLVYWGEGTPAPIIDTTGGFKASNISAMEYLSDADYAQYGYTAKRVSGMTPVVGNRHRLWFSMARTRRGLLGLHSSCYVGLSDSGYKGQRQPKSSMGVQDVRQPAGSLYFHVGSQQKVLEMGEVGAMCNFELRGRDLGTIAYSGIATRPGSLVRNLYLNKAHHGFAGIPNGEAGGLAIGARYDAQDIYIEDDAAGSSSPIMFNRATGGIMRRVYLGKHVIGMLTLWGSSGTHDWEDVGTKAGTTGINIEECDETTVLNWLRGFMHTDPASNTKHVNFNPSGRFIETHLRDVDVTLNSGIRQGHLIAHNYGDGTQQPKAKMTYDGGPTAYVNGTYV